jgi:hypothetical protein
MGNNCCSDEAHRHYQRDHTLNALKGRLISICEERIEIAERTLAGSLQFKQYREFMLVSCSFINICSMSYQCRLSSSQRTPHGLVSGPILNGTRETLIQRTRRPWALNLLRARILCSIHPPWNLPYSINWYRNWLVTRVPSSLCCWISTWLFSNESLRIPWSGTPGRTVDHHQIGSTISRFRTTSTTRESTRSITQASRLRNRRARTWRKYADQ